MPRSQLFFQPVCLRNCQCSEHPFCHTRIRWPPKFLPSSPRSMRKKSEMRSVLKNPAVRTEKKCRDFLLLASSRGRVRASFVGPTRCHIRSLSVLRGPALMERVKASFVRLDTARKSDLRPTLIEGLRARFSRLLVIARKSSWDVVSSSANPTPKGRPSLRPAPSALGKPRTKDQVP